MEPDDLQINYLQKGEWANEVRKSVKEWNDKLQASELINKNLWEVKYLGSDTEPLPNCDYPIYFEPWPKKSTDWFRVAGHFTWNFINIYFLGWSYCEVDNETVQCFNWSYIKSGPRQGGTIMHEIGHSLGLDHYFSDNPEVTSSWSQLSILPSVMISGINNHADVKQVRNIDIQKVRSLYGSEGFYAFSPEPAPKLPTPEPTPEPEPTPKYVPPKIPIEPFERIDITSSKIEVEPYSTEMIKIIGDISEEEFLIGQRVYIILEKPDGSTETLTITPTRKGHFETTLVFDNDSMRGSYEIWAIYMEQRDRNMDIIFEVVTKGKQTTSSLGIIKEITSSVSGIGKFDVSFSDNEYTFSGYLGGYDQSVRLIAENECPVKKEVYNKDYLLFSNRDTEASFTFYQLGQDKPEQCAMHLTLSDFFGNVLEQTTINYKIQTVEKSETTQSLETHPFALTIKQELVPEWVKNNARWWSEGQISDSDFISGIQQLIKENIISISDLPEQTTETTEGVPDWVRNNAGWWADGLITDEDFLKGIEYLVEQGIIKI